MDRRIWSRWSSGPRVKVSSRMAGGGWRKCSSCDASQTNVCMVLQRLRYGAVSLSERGRVGFGGVRQGRARGLDQEVVGAGAQGDRAGLAARADDAAGACREAADVLAVAAVRAAGELGGEAGREQQLEPERERVRTRGRLRVGVEQLELAAEQVVGRRVRLLRVEQPQHRVAGLRGALERRAALAQRRMGGDGLRLGDRAELAAPLVQDQVDPEQGLEPAAEARFDAPYPFRDRPHPSAFGGIQMEDAVRLAVAERTKNDRLALELAGHAYTQPPMSDANGRVTVYTTEPCGFCRQAKLLLESRGIEYDEVNLSHDPAGREALVARTGQM